ncbi:type I-C CRISPR-associated protein Cas7/Csd2 [Nitrosomonas communis]|uniref:CRISPR-associated protein Csd2 n=2 Tax=Nitrosomonadaceae TaxID=206379 RepID=A0A0F7KIY9_9PROT|nr:type I-C CRISPR-associated protein Cas7/Csd2 [Nitrosomonas communis]AKH38884.1 CRISPR-associated protein Csh2 [Nitrosomonas communis]TYP91899.1 CRISPR-associated protein Csd2 [Nitrosomonas communis]UVS61018.1 type I-C CRISPR-associated protein Cas7/Csd2 [Nitrosomonas sp. PLL12]SDW00174.1 CRISPR-associated protein Csd2 [Nitrosomonas communis]
MALNNRYDFVLLFDVKDGNPNGDPDAGNLPRVDAETGRGLVTDVSLKRKVRNFVGLTKGEQPPFEVYVKEKAILNNQNKRAYIGIGKSELLEGDDKKRKGGDAVDEARQWMCKNFYDVRTFGAVMSTGINCGQVRGPVQLTFARSIDPIVTQEHSITRMAVATEAEAEKQSGDNRTMGRKFTVPYGLYATHGFVSAHLANQTGFSGEDLELLWQSLVNMFEHDRSAARGEMATRGLYVFKHESELGNAPAYSLFERIQPRLKDGIVIPRSFEDYQVTVNEANMPSGVQLLRKVG